MFDFIDSLEKFGGLNRFKRAIWIGILIGSLNLAPNIANAQSDSEGDSAPPPAKASSAAKSGKSDGKTKRTKIDFEDQLIEGRATKPELFVLLQNRMNNSRRLFKLRENFLPELRKTAEDTARTGGGK